jgi:hypothetical protein
MRETQVRVTRKQRSGKEKAIFAGSGAEFIYEYAQKK